MHCDSPELRERLEHDASDTEFDNAGSEPATRALAFGAASACDAGVALAALHSPGPPDTPYRTGDVLDVVRTEILDGEAQRVEHLIACHAAYADPSRLGQRLQPRGDIDAVAKDVALIDDDVADVDADT